MLEIPFGENRKMKMGNIEVKKQIRHRKRPSMARRLALDNILMSVWSLGQMSDVGIYDVKKEFQSSLNRLKKQNPFMLIYPPAVEKARLASALKKQLGIGVESSWV